MKKREEGRIRTSNQGGSALGLSKGEVAPEDDLNRIEKRVPYNPDHHTMPARNKVTVWSAVYISSFFRRRRKMRLTMETGKCSPISIFFAILFL
jgi:hypothetical protein